MHDLTYYFELLLRMQYLLALLGPITCSFPQPVHRVMSDMEFASLQLETNVEEPVLHRLCCAQRTGYLLEVGPHDMNLHDKRLPQNTSGNNRMPN